MTQEQKAKAAETRREKQERLKARREKEQAFAAVLFELSKSSELPAAQRAKFAEAYGKITLMLY